MSGDERHLRLVTPPPAPPSVVQIAGYPGAYAVRRGGPAEALYSRQNSGDWHVLYGHDPAATDAGVAWRGLAVLPGNLADQQVVKAAVDLVDAYQLAPASAWHRLLAAAYGEGEVLAGVVRLHQPQQVADTIVCEGCDADRSDPVEWRCCPTVRLLARRLSVALNTPGGY